jgi:hypothetical protein
MSQLLAGDPTLALVGPFANGEAGTELVRTSRTMYVPPRYVPLFLTLDVSPQAGYESLVAAATSNNDLVNCAPLPKWMRLALTREAAAAALVLVQPTPNCPLG